MLAAAALVSKACMEAAVYIHMRASVCKHRTIAVASTMCGACHAWHYNCNKYIPLSLQTM